MQDAIAARRRRARLRAWRRGMREADLILGPFADARVPDMDAAALAGLEALLEEADADILAWVLGRAAPPEPHAALVAAIAAAAQTRHGTPGH